MPGNDHDFRRSIRLADFDYRTAGAYFITLCSHQRKAVFGSIKDGVMHCNFYGRIVEEEWIRMGELRANVSIDESIVMPNHFHAILVISNVDTTATGNSAGTVGAIVRGFKSAVTRRVNAHRQERKWAPVQVWQRSFYERIIRDERELLETRRYIVENPTNWPSDSYRA